jgi:hypothetical protein
MTLDDLIKKNEEDLKGHIKLLKEAGDFYQGILSYARKRENKYLELKRQVSNLIRDYDNGKLCEDRLSIRLEDLRTLIEYEELT